MSTELQCEGSVLIVQLEKFHLKLRYSCKVTIVTRYKVKVPGNLLNYEVQEISICYTYNIINVP